MNSIFAGLFSLLFLHYLIVLFQKADLKTRLQRHEEEILARERQAREQARQIEELRARVACMPTHEELIRACERFYDDCYSRL